MAYFSQTLSGCWDIAIYLVRGGLFSQFPQIDREFASAITQSFLELISANVWTFNKSTKIIVFLPPRFINYDRFIRFAQKNWPKKA